MKQRMRQIKNGS